MREGMREGLDRHAASLIVVSGGRCGEEHRVEGARCLVGRGPGVDITFDDPEMSQRHGLIEYARGRFRLTDLDSTNGTEVNGTGVASSELANGDRIRMGRHVLQLLIEWRPERYDASAERCEASPERLGG